MWLDMSINKRTPFVFRDEDKEPEVKALEKKHWMEIFRIEWEVMRWRKSNQIHAWFVKNIQEWEDDCWEYFVSKDDFVKLLDLVNKVLEDNSLAKTLLPPQEWFFFWSTEVDEWYFDDLEATKTFIEKELPNMDKYNYYYSSSW